MKAYMLGRKAGMTQLFNEDGKAVPVTVIECGPIKVVQKKSEEVDGYTAVKFGFLEANVHQVNKPDKGQFDKIESEPLKLLAECPMESTDEFELGQVISVSDNMNLGMLVEVRDQVLITFLSLAAFIAVIFFIKDSATKEPFFVERLISSASLSLYNA